MKNWTSRFVDGVQAPFQGISYLWKNRPLWKWAIVPLLIAVTSLSFAGYFAIGYLPGLLATVLPQGAGFLAGLVYWVGMIIAFVVYLVISLIGAYLAASIISIPFSSFLSEKVLLQVGAIEDRPFEFRRWFWIWLRMLRVSLVKALLFAILSVALLILSFFPLFQIPVAFLGFVVISFDMWDYSLELKEMGLQERLALMRTHFPELAGFASGVGLTFLVPGLNFLLFPGLIVGGTLLMAKKLD